MKINCLWTGFHMKFLPIPGKRTTIESQLSDMLSMTAFSVRINRRVKNVLTGHG